MIEFCFHVRYPERHGRDLEDPWVMRQLLVHQRYDFQSQTSTWIFLQCPAALQHHLIHVASQAQQAAAAGNDPMMTHMIILNYAFKNWRAYINYLEAVVEDLVSYICKICTAVPQI
jgi:hypothetical protein